MFLDWNRYILRKIEFQFQMSSTNLTFLSSMLRALDSLSNMDFKKHNTVLERYKNIKKQFINFQPQIEIRQREIDLEIAEIITDRYFFLLKSFCNQIF